MLMDLKRQLPSDDPPLAKVKCPLCGGILLRERRRMVDRLRSVFGPVQRYRCENFGCQWQGNVAHPRPDAGARDKAGEAPARSHAGRRSDRVPTSFVVHMVLVGLGIVFVLAISTMEPGFWLDEVEQAVWPGAYEVLPALSVDRTAAR